MIKVYKDANSINFILEKGNSRTITYMLFCITHGWILQIKKKAKNDEMLEKKIPNKTDWKNFFGEEIADLSPIGYSIKDLNAADFEFVNEILISTNYTKLWMNFPKLFSREATKLKMLSIPAVLYSLEGINMIPSDFNLPLIETLTASRFCRENKDFFKNISKETFLALTNTYFSYMSKEDYLFHNDSIIRFIAKQVKDIDNLIEISKRTNVELGVIIKKYQNILCKNPNYVLNDNIIVKERQANYVSPKVIKDMLSKDIPFLFKTFNLRNVCFYKGIKYVELNNGIAFVEYASPDIVEEFKDLGYDVIYVCPMELSN